MRNNVGVLVLVIGSAISLASCSGVRAGPDSSRLIFTFSVTVPYHMPEAMERMADVVHEQDVPINWQISLDDAIKVKSRLEEYHNEYGDELIAMGSEQDYDVWREHFRWAALTVAGPDIPSPDEYDHRLQGGIAGSWGYCDQQVGVDGITHWGCPWGLFLASPKNPLIPANGQGQIVGIPWTTRDLHKAYHMKQPINFALDPMDQIRSRTLCRGKDISYFRDILDELIENTGWNERVYCCLHEEANGPFIPKGKAESDEGATPETSELMYQMISEWLRYARNCGVRVLTLPEAIADYQEVSQGETLSSTILTRDKYHGPITYYIPPFPPGIRLGQSGPAGHFPNTLFHYDKDCQMVFVHPELLPKYVLDYGAQHPWEPNRPYPVEQVMPTLVDWWSQRDDSTRTFIYQLQFWHEMPFGVAEWGNFKGWEVVETDGLYANIIDDRVLFLRMDLTNDTGTERETRFCGIIGKQYLVRLRPKKK